MSATFDLLAVMTAIANLSVTDVSFKDAGDLIESMKMSHGVMHVREVDPITNVNCVAAEFSAQKLTLIYTLNYKYYHCLIPQGAGGLFASWEGLLSKIAEIYVALCNDTLLNGALDQRSTVVDGIGPIIDPSGNGFLGCEFHLTITQFLEV